MRSDRGSRPSSSDRASASPGGAPHSLRDALRKSLDAILRPGPRPQPGARSPEVGPSPGPAPSASNAPGEERPNRHESIVITRTPEELRIEWPWHPPRTRRIFLLVALGLALTCAGGVAIDPSTIYAVPLGLVVLYFVVAPALNRTIVRLGHGKLRAYQRPLPFPVHGSARVAEIEAVQAGTVRSGGGGGGLQGDAHQSVAEHGSRTAVASARLLSGDKVRLFREFDDGWAGRYDARVRFVVDELNRELASGRWAGEARSRRRR